MECVRDRQTDNAPSHFGAVARLIPRCEKSWPIGSEASCWFEFR
eukprot:SAG22_NODE_16375_length_326_cov_1.273128_1_plen_43_part_10